MEERLFKEDRKDRLIYRLSSTFEIVQKLSIKFLPSEVVTLEKDHGKINVFIWHSSKWNFFATVLNSSYKSVFKAYEGG